MVFQEQEEQDPASDPAHLLAMWHGLRTRVLDRTREDYFRVVEACDHDGARSFYWLWQVLGKSAELVQAQVDRWTLEGRRVLPHEFAPTFAILMDQAYAQVQSQVIRAEVQAQDFSQQAGQEEKG